MEKNKGITLISLVITIIVLIILAGVAISMLSGDNGILRRATDASKKTDFAGKNENSTLGSYEDVIAEATGTVPLVTYENVSELTEPVAQKTKYKDKNGDIAVIPRGFKISNVAKEGDTTPGEQTIKTGLVVIAPDESEFVWIPVENPSIMYGTDASGNKLGKLYENGDIESPLYWSESNGVMSLIGENNEREPDYVPSTASGDASTTANRGLNLLSEIIGIEGTVGTDNELMLNSWKNQLQNEFNEMIQSVKVNHGFYVGRYEISLKENENEKIIQSKKQEESSLASDNDTRTWYGLYQKQKEYSLRNDLTAVVGSSMIWGSQYDQMMIWMKNNGINVEITTPPTIEYPDGTSINKERITGKDEGDKLNNVYDLLGNSIEWTLEAGNTTYRVLR